MKLPVEDRTDEIQRLQSCINDLISVLALPALWSGHNSSQIIGTLLDGLVGMMRLDFAYARLPDSIDGTPLELVRLAQRGNPAAHPQKVGQALNRWLTDTPTSPLVVPSPIGAGEVSIAFFRLGVRDEIGVLVAGSQRDDFPTQIEMLLLRVAANQATIGLQEARRMSEQRRFAEELEQRVAERTSQLATLNAGLREEIAERERVEQDQRKLAALVEHSIDFIAVASLDGRILFVNPAGQKMVGLQAEQVRATRMLDYMEEQEWERWEGQVLPAVRREGRWEGELHIRNFKTGELIPMLHHAFFIKEERSNRPVALATISRDLTGRKRAEEALRLAHAELAHATRVLTVGELTSSIAHEVNQPLGAIVTNASASLHLLSRKVPDIAGIREAIECIIGDAMRASQVIKGIRALLKRTAAERAPVNVNETIQEVITVTANELARNQVLLRMELAADLPRVVGDRIQLQQVLLNLILNGNEAMSGVGPKPRELLITSQKSGSDRVVVAVRDSGTGLKPEDHERIFDAFFTTKGSGLGLGLSISRTIIEDHGGRLWATPNDERGTTLQFTLPAGAESGS